MLQQQLCNMETVHKLTTVMSLRPSPPKNNKYMKTNNHSNIYTLSAITRHVIKDPELYTAWDSLFILV